MPEKNKRIHREIFWRQTGETLEIIKVLSIFIAASIIVHSLITSKSL